MGEGSWEEKVSLNMWIRLVIIEVMGKKFRKIFLGVLGNVF